MRSDLKAFSQHCFQLKKLFLVQAVHHYDQNRSSWTPPIYIHCHSKYTHINTVYCVYSLSLSGAVYSLALNLLVIVSESYDYRS